MADVRHDGNVAEAPCALRLDPGAVHIDLGEMARCPLPGAIAALAAAAAMGTALAAKVARLAERRGRPEEPSQAEMKGLVACADLDVTALLGLVGADNLAYRAVLDTRRLPPRDPERQRAWLSASEVPLRLAELTIRLERRIPELLERCPPLARLDLQVGAWLLHAASEGGLRAAEENLGHCEEGDESGSLRLRMAALKEIQGD